MRPSAATEGIDAARVSPDRIAVLVLVRLRPSLPAASRADITLIACNCGDAGALAFYRDRVRIPYPRSTAGDFRVWGPGPTSGSDVIVTGAASVGDILRILYDTIEVASTTDDPLGVPEERKVFIHHARGARATLATMWPKLGPNWN